MDKIEKIRAEIERLKSTNPSEYNYQNAEGYVWALDDILSFIDTLSEEPDKSLEEAANEFCKTIFHKPFSENPQEEQIVYDGDRYVGFIAGAKWQVEQFEKNRLAACEKQTKEEYDREMEFAVSIIEKEHRQPTFSDAINYGIEWQKKQIPMPEDTVLFNKGVAEGKRLMTEGAIEGEVYKYDKFSYVKEKNSNSLTEALTKFNDGDTVKIIIVKEDEK